MTDRLLLHSGWKMEGAEPIQAGGGASPWTAQTHGQPARQTSVSAVLYVSGLLEEAGEPGEPQDLR